MSIPENVKVNPSIITIFGGSGDLTWRKLIPALFNLYLAGWLSDKYKIICLGKSEISNEDFASKLKDGIDKFSRTGVPKQEDWNSFAKNIEYKIADFTNATFYSELKSEIENFEKISESPSIKLFYLAVNPQFFSQIANNIASVGLANDRANARLVVEKPFGTDLNSAKKLNADLLLNFYESQIYRIDHYLGKETVQNILAFRFANILFEPIWNRNFIDNIQITVAEKIGVEDRGNYYNNSGALRDMIQNHVLQLFCLIAMEAPVNFNADEIRNKKVDVLNAVRIIKEDEVNSFAVRGQYDEGWVEGEKVKSYLQEKYIPAGSCTETFAALNLFIDNWRWNGVPFYIRSGKRMEQTLSSITIEFKPVPHQSFPETAIQSWGAPNRMILNIQPDMGIRLTFQAKKPGLQMHLAPVDMLFNYKQAYPSGLPEGYETLLLDVLQGEATLFMRADQVESAWKIVMPVLSAWLANSSPNFPNYKAGTNGPEHGNTLIAKGGDAWVMKPFTESEAKIC